MSFISIQLYGIDLILPIVLVTGTCSRKCKRKNFAFVFYTSCIQFQTLIVDYFTVLVPVSLKLRNNRF